MRRDPARRLHLQLVPELPLAPAAGTGPGAAAGGSWLGCRGWVETRLCAHRSLTAHSSFQGTRGFSRLHGRWLPSLIYCSIPKASPSWAQCEQTGAQEAKTTMEIQVHSHRAAPPLGQRQRKIPASFLCSSGFIEPGKEVNSKGRK
ncbi:hypothetical protein D623_10033416 [Myotis brandtii]|uniref:Uncharacterized protein n=1 Tax=Myotis brandtii TaxID=109478 RepID=S7P9A9_MYOBR|nr:hypothetical protein D623_10033416 [Myotis brandtii]